MKKSLPVMILFLCFGSFRASSQEMTTDSILSKYYQVIGADKLKSWNTVIMTGKSTSQGMEFPVTITIKRPEKIRIVVEIQGNKMIQAFDGKTGWNVSPWAGTSEPQDMTADEVKIMKEQSDPEGVLVNWKEKGHKVEYTGKDMMDGTPVYKIKVIKANDNTETDFIDAENFVPVKILAITKFQGNETESESYPGNYKLVEGVLLPFSIENRYKNPNGQYSSQFVIIDKYEVNKEVSDSLFMRPAKKQ